MLVAFVFILGLLVGSFLNVVIFRLHRGESFISGNSKCLFCSHKLKARDLVPLFSYLFLKGRCRHCKHKFSAQYFLVEIATALSFVLIYINIFPNLDILSGSWLDIWQLFVWFTMVSWLIIIFVYDLRHYLILDIVVIPAIVLALIFNFVLGFNILHLLLAALVGGGFFLFQFLISKGKWIGGGDIRLGVFMGVLLGWPHILTALFLAYILGSVISIILLTTNKKHLTDKVPFGTFLTLATIITMLYGDWLVAWYWSILSF